MSISAELVRRMSALARLRFDEEESDRMRGELQRLLDYFGQVSAVDTSNVSATTHVVPLTNRFRSDRVADPQAEGLLELAPDVSDRFIRVPGFRKGEG